MAKIAITGATGNVGRETVRFLSQIAEDHEIVLCQRRRTDSNQLLDGAHMTTVAFDFENPETFDGAFSGVDIFFLLRPPHIADVEGVFRPMLRSAFESGIRKIVFLSVQGADKASYIPHAKIERIIREFGFDYVFLRPSYFMQNFTTTLITDVREGMVVLPSGTAIFNWVDVSDIGEVAAHILNDFDRHSNRSVEITGVENKSFPEAIFIINEAIGTSLKYKSVGLLRFYRHKRRQGVSRPMIMVMIMLHFLPRFQKPPHISNTYVEIIGKQPTTLAEFARTEADKFLKC